MGEGGREGEAHMCLPCLSLRNVSSARVSRGGWGLLAAGHCCDGELPFWAGSSLHSLALWGEEVQSRRQGEGGKRKKGRERQQCTNTKPLLPVRGLHGIR